MEKDRFLIVLLSIWVQPHLRVVPGLSSYLSQLSYLCAQNSLSCTIDIYHLSSQCYML